MWLPDQPRTFSIALQTFNMDKRLMQCSFFEKCSDDNIRMLVVSGVMQKQNLQEAFFWRWEISEVSQ